MHGISARQVPPPGAGVQWLRTRDTRAAFLLLRNPGGVCSQQHEGKRGHSTALCAACDRNAEATCAGQGVLPAVLRLGRPQVCSARYLGWQLGRRRNTERRGNKGNRKQGTSLREKNTQPRCCSWHQRSLRAALKQPGASCCLQCPLVLHQHCGSRGPPAQGWKGTGVQWGHSAELFEHPEDPHGVV